MVGDRSARQTCSRGRSRPRASGPWRSNATASGWTYDPRVDEERLPLLGLVAGAGLAAAGLLLAGAKGAPYLTTDSVNVWIVVFASACWCAVLNAVRHRARMRSAIEESDKRWERALLAWGAVSIGCCWRASCSASRPTGRRATRSPAPPGL